MKHTEKEKKPSFRLLTVITTPKLAEKATDMFCGDALPIQYRFNAEGTASSEMMDMLGLGSIDKCVLASVMSTQFANTMLRRLHTELQLDTINSGIAFTIPINGANNLALQMLAQSGKEQEQQTDGRGETTMSDIKHSVIAAIVNRGFSGDVMSAAREAGARGGTVIHSRHVGSEEAAGFWGVGMQEEKEIVLIISEAESKVAIMKEIMDHCGMQSDAKGIVVSMPIDSVIGI
ncbi:MAG: hypothetical protein J1E39_07355 [Eubacterium sp.]|nr:hypothetical protein [Eubacterium sp.]